MNSFAVMRTYFCTILVCIFTVHLSAQDNNPFNVFRSSDGESEGIVQDTTMEEDVTKIGGENPFDISHLPIRKNQYQEIERLTLTNESVQETISISYKPLWSIILSLCILAVIIGIRKNHMVSLFKSEFNENFLRLMQYESDGGRHAIYLLGYLLFLANVSLVLYLILKQYFEVNINSLYLYILGASVVFFIGKHIMIGFVSWVINTRKEGALYNFKIITDYSLLGIIFLILNILIVFGPEIWLKYIGILAVVVYLIFLISRYWRGFRIVKNYISQHFFHFFIYFCGFEIMPWVIVYILVKSLF